MKWTHGDMSPAVSGTDRDTPLKGCPDVPLSSTLPSEANGTTRAGGTDLGTDSCATIEA
jgi:hypothetical protein